ncbi:MAG: UDP-N-acetylglucosamine 2-epimerase (hydrolyzing) [Lachnospiraceae bacterium]|nr:UDP-N-acetylglucosamine 2-epimerase (hydrolyzing) [Lachnospiraceae bacterium]
MIENRKYKIAVATTTRAEYGLLSPLIRRIMNDEDLELKLLVSGTHLSKQHGHTIDEIIEDGIPIAHKIPIMVEGNDSYAVSATMANAIVKFAECLRDDRPDLLFVSGDRTEMLGIACAAMNERILMAHYSGGEVTEGAVDDCVRHSLSKMSYLHFTSTEAYRKRVIQLGEAPERVFNVGALGMENIIYAPLMNEKEIRRECHIPVGMEYAVVTFHPVTLEGHTAEEQAHLLCNVMDRKSENFYLMTKANADVGGDVVNRILEDYAKSHVEARLVDSLGMIRYLSAVKYASFVLGNSSSGMVEAPILGTPTVNIGDRQKGRIVSETVINCEPVMGKILAAIEQAKKMTHIPTQIYGDGTASKEIVYVIKDILKSGIINLKKGFYEENF